MDTVTASLAFAALVWSGWQEIRLWKMCTNCPYYVDAISKEKKMV